MQIIIHRPQGGQHN